MRTSSVAGVIALTLAATPVVAQTVTMENLDTVVGKHFTSPRTMLLHDCMPSFDRGQCEGVQWIFGKVGFTITGIARIGPHDAFAKVRLDDGRTGYTAPNSDWDSDKALAARAAAVERGEADCRARKPLTIGMTEEEVIASRCCTCGSRNTVAGLP
jgi:hypothetical protein